MSNPTGKPHTKQKFNNGNRQYENRQQYSNGTPNGPPTWNGSKGKKSNNRGDFTQYVWDGHYNNVTLRAAIPYHQQNSYLGHPVQMVYPDPPPPPPEVVGHVGHQQHPPQQYNQQEPQMPCNEPYQGNPNPPYQGNPQPSYQGTPASYQEDPIASYQGNPDPPYQGNPAPYQGYHPQQSQGYPPHPGNVQQMVPQQFQQLPPGNGFVQQQQPPPPPAMMAQNPGYYAEHQGQGNFVMENQQEQLQSPNEQSSNQQNPTDQQAQENVKMEEPERSVSQPAQDGPAQQEIVPNQEYVPQQVQVYDNHYQQHQHPNVQMVPMPPQQQQFAMNPYQAPTVQGMYPQNVPMNWNGSVPMPMNGNPRVVPYYNDIHQMNQMPQGVPPLPMNMYPHPNQQMMTWNQPTHDQVFNQQNVDYRQFPPQIEIPDAQKMQRGSPSANTSVSQAESGFVEMAEEKKSTEVVRTQTGTHLERLGKDLINVVHESGHKFAVPANNMEAIEITTNALKMESNKWLAEQNKELKEQVNSLMERVTILEKKDKNEAQVPEPCQKPSDCSNPEEIAAPIKTEESEEPPSALTVDETPVDSVVHESRDASSEAILVEVVIAPEAMTPVKIETTEASAQAFTPSQDHKEEVASAPIPVPTAEELREQKAAEKKARKEAEERRLAEKKKEKELENRRKKEKKKADEEAKKAKKLADKLRSQAENQEKMALEKARREQEEKEKKEKEKHEKAQRKEMQNRKNQLKKERIAMEAAKKEQELLEEQQLFEAAEQFNTDYKIQQAVIAERKKQALKRAERSQGSRFYLLETMETVHEDNEGPYSGCPSIVEYDSEPTSVSDEAEIGSLVDEVCDEDEEELVEENKEQELLNEWNKYGDDWGVVEENEEKPAQPLLLQEAEEVHGVKEDLTNVDDDDIEIYEENGEIYYEVEEDLYYDADVIPIFPIC